MDRRRRRQLQRLRRVGFLMPIVGLGSLYALGSWLPPVQRARSEVVLPGSPETLWTVLMDLDGMPAWREGLRSLERLPAAGGRERWREVRDGGTVALERVEAIPPRRMVVSVAQPDSVAAARWIYRIEPTAAGSRLELIEERPVANRFLRPLAYLFWGGPQRVHALCHDLAQRLAAARPVIAER